LFSRADSFAWQENSLTHAFEYAVREENTLDTRFNVGLTLHQFPEHLYRLNQAIHFLVVELLNVDVQSNGSPRLGVRHPAALRRADASVNLCS
jgi:hypothetical protein